MLAEVVLPLVLIQHRHRPQVLDGMEHIRVAYRHGIGLIDHQVVRFPPLPQDVVRLIQQGEYILLLQQAVQHLLCDIDLINHDVIVIGVLCGDDNAQFVGQRDLGGAHRLHRVAV